MAAVVVLEREVGVEREEAIKVATNASDRNLLLLEEVEGAAVWIKRNQLGSLASRRMDWAVPRLLHKTKAPWVEAAEVVI